MEIVLNDLECGSNGNNDIDEKNDDPFSGPADERADDPDDEGGGVRSTADSAGAFDSERGDEEEADEEQCSTEISTESTSDNEGTADEERASPSASRDEKAKGRYCKAAAMILVVWGVAIALLFITLGLGLEWWNGRFYPPDEDLCTLCGEDGLDLFTVDEGTPFPTRQPSREPDPVHLFSYSHRARSLNGAVGE